LNGYASGGSIHIKLQSATQQRQLHYLHPFFCHWAGDKDDIAMNTTRSTISPMRIPDSGPGKKEAGRRRAAPHIKTYIRFSDKSRMDRIDWAMLTSANLSTQAWGAVPNANGEVRICSWEIGVIVWPDLIAGDYNNAESNIQAEMIPCFRKDVPDLPSSSVTNVPVVGFRMPYDLPLTPYNSHDFPWCATTSHLEPDWLGQTWEL
jgi:tyrosyl-DNA phosphodiesterase-1